MSTLPETRQRLEAKIAELIDMLDLLDGDCDLEDTGDDEPSIPSTPRCNSHGVQYDLEEDPAELGIGDFDGLDWVRMEGSFAPLKDCGFDFDGSGRRQARRMLRCKRTRQ